MEFNCAKRCFVQYVKILSVRIEFEETFRKLSAKHIR